MRGLLLLGPNGVDTVGEFLGLGVVGELALHPDEIREGSVGDSAVDGALGAALVAVVSLASTGSVPVEVDVGAGDALGDGAGLGVALALGGLAELLNESLLVGEGALVDGVDNGVAEELQTCLGDPFVFNGLELSAVLAGLLSDDHEVVEGLEVSVGRAKDEGMVAVIDGRGNEGSGLRVGTSNSQKVSCYRSC